MPNQSNRKPYSYTQAWTNSKKNDRFIGVNEMRGTRVLDQGRPPARQDQVICPARSNVSR